MIYIFYCISRDRLKPEYFSYYLQQLTPAIQNEVIKFKNWQDIQRSLLSKTLLIRGLKALGLRSYSLDQLKLTEFKRPYFDDLVDFNISHSGEYVVCAISKTNRIGIDIEEIKDIPLLEFENQFSKQELEEILQNKNSLHAFYTLWTQKEAFLKAIGTGLYVPLNKISVKENKIIWNNVKWFLHEIKLDLKYVSHLSTDIFFPQIILKKVDVYGDLNN